MADTMPCDFVYAIRSNKAVKIGYTAQPRRRIASLRVGLAHDIVGAACVAVAAGQGKIFEKRLHTRFKAKRARGEWFRIQMTDAINALGEIGPVQYPLEPGWREPTRGWRTFDPDEGEASKAHIATIVQIIKGGDVPFTEVFWNSDGKGYRRTQTWSYP